MPALVSLGTVPATPLHSTPGRAGPPGRAAVLLGWLAYALVQVGAPTGPAVEALAGAAVLAAASLLAVALAGRLPAVRDADVDQAGQTATIRQRSRRFRTPRQLDPDAAGRPRPRAPSVHPSAG
ncbi:DUF6412 domain-containing protein [Plantactinospora sp. KLBMP9567]|uniref:DUF6412 domain-containing protein n=1 Tax=Plantactinospora sp. KLBMP9567 TaxID=3085900 RepID=UPI0029824D70|nr:DUF6412 domain-containing protein [Plantactinospora sp. KLBMP9567]MDW5330521.1 DUF6412 domain-containing protein [Plantactinospora sp. KLBMP9567]